MIRFVGIIVSAVLMIAAQTSIAFEDQVRLKGFSSESDAVKASKEVVQQFADEVQKIAYALPPDCLYPGDPEVIDVQVEKKYKPNANSLTETYEAIINYEYRCETISPP